MAVSILPVRNRARALQFLPDKRSKNRFKMRDLRRLLKYLLPHTGTFVIATFAMIVRAVLETATSALIVPIFDQALAHGNPRPTPTPFALQRLIPASGLHAWLMIALLLIVFTLVKGIAEYFSTYLMAHIGQSSILRLRQEFYSHLLSQSAAFFERHRTNYLVSRLISSAAGIETAVPHPFRQPLRESFTLIRLLATAFYVNWRLTLGSLIIAPPIAGLTMKFGSSLRRLARESFEGSKRMTDTAQEALANHNIVTAYGGEDRERSRFKIVAERINRADLRSASFAGMAPPIIELIGVLFFVGLLFFGEREIRLGRINIAQFFTFLLLLVRSYDPMRKLSRLQNSFSQALAAAQHVWEVLDEHAEIVEKPNAIELPPLRNEIEFRDVRFGYAEEGRPVLRDINLSVLAGSMVALVGQSGGGKSTLTKLLPRFHDPSSGQVLWDGVDLRDAKLKSLRRQIALVTKETVLFNDTVRYNITYGHPNATQEAIEDAAR